MKGARPRAVYWGIAGISFVAMVGSYAPSPLYRLYQDRWVMADSTVGLAFAGYGAGSIVVLTLLGGLSDVWGRRRTLIFGMAGYAVALVLLAVAFSPAALIGARVFQGAFAAVLTSTTAAILMESHPSGRVHRGAVVSGVALFFGTALGPLLSGLLVTHFPMPFQSPYVMTLMFLIACSIAVVGLVAGGRTRPGRLVRPVHVPRVLLGPFSLGAGAIAIHNVSIGVFGTFSGTIATTAGHPSPADAGLLMFVLMAMVTASMCVLQRMQFHWLITMGALVTASGWAIFAFATAAGWYLLLAAVTVIGIGGGMLFLGGTSLIGQIAPEGKRAEIYSGSLLAALIVFMSSSTLFGAGIGSMGAIQTSLVAAGIAIGFTTLIMLGTVFARQLLPGD